MGHILLLEANWLLSLCPLFFPFAVGISYLDALYQDALSSLPMSSEIRPGYYWLVVAATTSSSSHLPSNNPESSRENNRKKHANISQSQFKVPQFVPAYPPLPGWPMFPFHRTEKQAQSHMGTDATTLFVKSNEYPYHVSIDFKARGTWKSICNGALILSPVTGKQIVLTAGHCVTNNQGLALNAAVFSVRAGLQTLKTPDNDSNKRLLIRQILVHGKFTRRDRFYYHDIAILVLDGSFQLNPTLDAIDMPPIGENYFGYLNLSSWDYRRKNTIVGVSAKEVAMITKEYYKKHYHIGHNETGLPYGTIVVRLTGSNDWEDCQEDGGSPAVARLKDGRGNKRKYLLGIVSMGHGCVAPGHPGILVKVSSYIRWIIESLYSLEEY